MAPAVRIRRIAKIVSVKPDLKLCQKSEFARNFPHRLIPISCEKLGKQGLGMGH
jgi:hypothetical protein